MVNEVDEMCIVVDTVVNTIVSVEFSEYEVEVSKVDEVVVDEVDKVCIVVDTVVDTIVSVELSEYEVEVSKVEEVVVEEVDDFALVVLWTKVVLGIRGNFIHSPSSHSRSTTLPERKCHKLSYNSLPSQTCTQIKSLFSIKLPNL